MLSELAKDELSELSELADAARELAKCRNRPSELAEDELSAI